MGTIIIAMPKEDNSNNLAEIVKRHGLLHDIEVCRTSADVLRISNDRDYGLVICTKKIMEMGYMELAGYLPQCFGMVILTKDMTVETFSENMMKLTLPVKPKELISTIDMMMSFLERRIRKKKKAPPRRSAAEQKIIDEAKNLLMERNGMSEPESFRYIQKCSMDTGRNMVESAQMILMLSD